TQIAQTSMTALKHIFILFLIVSTIPSANSGLLGFFLGGSVCVAGCTVAYTVCLGGTAAAGAATAGAAVPVGATVCTVSFNTCVGTCTITVTVSTGPF
ncbi:unnamed protein product, partial [Rotaria sp. Silwood2]